MRLIQRYFQKLCASVPIVAVPVSAIMKAVLTVKAESVRVYMKAREAVERRMVVMLRTGISPSGLKAYFSEVTSDAYMANPQRGAITVEVIIGIIIGIFLLVFLITYLWQTGIPEVISATGNTTAIEEAGASSSQVSFVTMAGGLLVFLLLASAIYLGMRALGFGTGKGGGGRRRARKRSK